MPYVAKTEEVDALIERKLQGNRTPDNTQGHDPWMLHEISTDTYPTGGQAKKAAKEKYGPNYHLPKEQSWDVYLAAQLTDVQVPAALIPLLVRAIQYQDADKISTLKKVCHWYFQESERQAVNDLAEADEYLYRLERLIYNHLSRFRPPTQQPPVKCKTCDSIGAGDCERRQFAGTC